MVEEEGTQREREKKEKKEKEKEKEEGKVGEGREKRPEIEHTGVKEREMFFFSFSRTLEFRLATA